MVRRCCAITLVVFAALLLILALLLLVAFPLGIFPSLLKSKIPIKTDEDGQMQKSGFYWSKPPADTNYDFYLFHYQNDDDITYFGQTPSVIEKGPYRWKQQDTKIDIAFGPGNSNISYSTTKTYVFSKEGSCADCNYDDDLVQPNLSVMTMARLLFENDGTLNDTQKTLADLTTLFLGVYPFTKVKMAEVLYLGYTDGLLDFLNSRFQQDLKEAFGNILGFEPPNIKLLGYFAGYNGTTDGEYVALTGQNDVKKSGLIQQWRNTKKLDFWNSTYANDITDTTDGALSGSFLKKDESLNLFQSFLCRHFKLNFAGEETIEGIKSYKYSFDADNLNPYTKKFAGYMYNNDEQFDYFPNWTKNATNPEKIPLPPGLVQQKCLPGKLDKLPFVAFASEPHFLNAPDEVKQSINGLKPNKETHSLGEFNIQPTLGSALRANVRSQLNIAFHQTNHLTSMYHTASAIMPAFWLHTGVKLRPYAYNFIKQSTVTIPKLALYVGIGIAVASGVCVILLIVLIVVGKRKEAKSRL